MLSSERPFPQNVGQVKPADIYRDVSRSVRELREAASAMRSALIELEASIDALARDSSPQGLGRSVHVVPAPSMSEIDPVIDRVEMLRVGCEEILRRPLRGVERGIVLAWALLEREGALVPVSEILDLTRRLLSRPTPDGTLPSTLKWCDATVQTLARSSVAALRGRGARTQAAELASLYEEMADRLDSEEAGS